MTMTMSDVCAGWWYRDVFAKIVPTWAGIPVRKYPTDLFVYQEIILRYRPAVVIETGGWCGGATLYFAQLLDMLGDDDAVAGDRRVISIDTAPRWHPSVVAHPRVVTLVGSSTEPAIIADVTAGVDGRAVFIILDSDHHAAHVRAELAAYAPLAHKGDWLIVEDTNVNGHPLPIGPDGGALAPGPWEAVEEFLAEHREWSRDRVWERRMGLTCAPGGWLHRL